MQPETETPITRHLPDRPALDSVRERLLVQAHLFEDWGAYRAGVQDAIDAVRPLVEE